MIDIGANIGDTVLIVRQQADLPILAVEPDERFFDVLETNVRGLSSVRVLRTFLAERSGPIDGQLLARHGSARLVPTGVPGRIRARSLPEVLRDYPEYQDAMLLKSDTDGLDGAILRGARSFLSDVKPVLFFEYDPFLSSFANGRIRQLLDELTELGYRTALVYENTGEYAGTVDIADPVQADRFHEGYVGWEGKRYADVCVFSADDSAVCAEIAQSETVLASVTTARA
jgi:FkbM family methyltransferase